MQLEAELRQLRDMPAWDWHAPGLYERYGKRAIDLVGAVVLLLFVAPILAIVALAVLCALGRPVLLKQNRVGLRGNAFGVYKFRSMAPDRRARALPVTEERRQTHKHPNDPRLGSLGRMLRRYSLDELPQLFNVLRGEMSLVGPRPELQTVVDQHYDDWQHARHAVRPGLTGLWQITKRGEGLMHRHTLTDLEYVSEITFVGDIQIMLRTLPAALGAHRGT